MLSVVARLETAAEGSGTVTFVGAASGDAEPADRVEWARLHDDARGIAAALQARGVGPGVHVGILGPTTRTLVTTIQATFLAGGTVVALPLPMRLGSIEEFVEQTQTRIANADAALVVVDPDARAVPRPTVGRRARRVARRTGPGGHAHRAPVRGRDRPTIPSGWRSCSSRPAPPRRRRA